LNRKRLQFNFIGRSRIWFIISAIVILAGLAGYFIQGGFNFGIDFLGGTLIEVEFDEETESEQIREVLTIEGYGSSVIQQTDSNKYIIRINSRIIGNKDVREVLIDLDRVILIELFTMPAYPIFFDCGVFSLILSNTTIVSLSEYPIIVKSAAIVDVFISRFNIAYIPSVTSTS